MKRLVLGEMGLCDNLTLASGNDFTPFQLVLAAGPFFQSIYLDTRSKDTFSEGPELGIVLASQCTCNWSIKLLRKTGSFTEVNTEILKATVQRWRGQVFVPILEMRK